MMRPSRSRILPRGARMGTCLMRFCSASDAVVVAARDLQTPQAEGENKKNSQQDVLHCGEPELRDFVLAT